jgi:dienelactone hydrolase
VALLHPDMPSPIQLGLLTTTVLVWLALPGTASADTQTNITFDSIVPGEELDGRLYLPDPMPESPPAIIMMHGCTGLWSGSDPATGVGQRHIEKWGLELAAQGYVVLAVDSYTTRTPAAATEAEYQHQCNSDPTWKHHVNSYTTRVDDIESAQEYLIAEYDVNTEGGLGLLGWSQGAQSVLVAMAATPRASNVAYVDPPAYAAAVTFYPGCGSALGYGMSYTLNRPGYWRPANPMRLHHGTSDSLHGDCQWRSTNAWAVYPESLPSADDELLWVSYPGVGHSFDHVGTNTAFPTSKCDAAALADVTRKAECAMRDADIDSLAFILDEVVGG